MIINIIFLFRFKKIKFNNYVYVHNISAEKVLGLVICSGDVETLLITSPNTSSTLNLVEFIFSFLLSI